MRFKQKAKLFDSSLTRWLEFEIKIYNVVLTALKFVYTTAKKISTRMYFFTLIFHMLTFQHNKTILVLGAAIFYPFISFLFALSRPRISQRMLIPAE